MSTTFYISIASSVAFVLSEILPFINDTKVNGILHSIKIFLENCKSNQVSDGGNIEKLKNDFDQKSKETDSFIVDIKNEVNIIKADVNDIKSCLPETDNVIINIKSDVNDIKNDVNDIKTNINDIKNMFEQSEII
jgi:peptidoglycan hydrolase CwlO-like protein